MSKNNIFNRYPPIIHGEARGENDEFVVHTRYPRFLARRSFDDGFSGDLPTAVIKGQIGKTENGKLAYDSGIGIWFSDFIFFDSRSENEAEFLKQLTDACNKCTADTVMLDEETF
ncbi:hypothetical protein [Neisseria sp. S1]|uniref:hypothetical protein n=1 Tax=Neisseria sp. S1 TaxID=3318354 RepID=UPI003A8BC257